MVVLAADFGFVAVLLFKAKRVQTTEHGGRHLAGTTWGFKQKNAKLDAQ